ncbi:hypothetical protein CGRA01v4_10805 [Colletotrichum graminicola]|nr:hypothetical protein CGRA01v4_10805 [Colletotrichum graminicola]
MQGRRPARIGHGHGHDSTARLTLPAGYPEPLPGLGGGAGGHDAMGHQGHKGAPSNKMFLSQGSSVRVPTGDS